MDTRAARGRRHAERGTHQADGSQARGLRPAGQPRYPLSVSHSPLSTLHSPLSPRSGFTLVELLVVIVIIGILAALLTGAVVAARLAARRAVIRSDISQLEMALERYKNEVGEYPPDFSYLNNDDDSTTDTDEEIAAKRVLTRHLRKRFPRYTGNWDTFVAAVGASYFDNAGTPGDTSDDIPLDLNRLDQSSALVFWLGGLPERARGTRPAGFSADPARPYLTGRPRTEPFFDFDEEKLEFAASGFLRYRYVPDLPAGLPEAPYVYFRSARHNVSGNNSYLFTFRDTASPPVDQAFTRYWPNLNTTSHGWDVPSYGVAVPYRNGAPNAENYWRADSTYQIISAGLDGAFSNPTDVDDPTTFPVTITGVLFTAGDYDNMTNFAAGKLENEL